MRSDLPNVNRKPLTFGGVETALNHAFVRVYGGLFNPVPGEPQKRIDREAVARLQKMGMAPKQIAHALGFDLSTVYDALKRVGSDAA